jgi:hypothetical protein
MKQTLESAFNLKTFSFNTGVSVSINENKISANGNGKNVSIDTHQLDNFSYQEYWEGRISQAGLWFRFVGISILLIIYESVIGGWSTSSWIFFGIMIAINILYIIVFMFDILLELNIFKKVIKQFFSNHCYAVTIGNKSGNNIDFYAFLDEKEKLNELDILLTKLKHKKASIISKINNPVVTHSNLDELQKLGELYKNGILTEEEFNNKKQELLNK